MNELFTTEIAMGANKINLVNFDFTWTLNQKIPENMLWFNKNVIKMISEGSCDTKAWSDMG